MSKAGWIKLHRQITENDIWQNSDPFDKRSAWIDLLIMANHKDEKIYFNGSSILVERGQLITSVRKLAERWHWGKDKTLRYLRFLEERDMVKRTVIKGETQSETQSETRTGTRLTIVNYGFYQCLIDTNRDGGKDTNKPQTININKLNNIYRPKNGFNNFQKTDYDIASIERSLGIE